MDTTQPGTDAALPPRRGWPLFVMGVLLFLLGPALYVVQVRMQSLAMPWYLPVMATLGVVLALAAVLRRRGVLLCIGLALLAVICTFEWFMLLVAMKAPAYAGPSTPGQKVPAFSTTLADGSSFSNKNLETGQDTVLLFFRGRW